jgi:hypothetical protein
VKKISPVISLQSPSRLPSRITYGELKLLPYWDPLRGDPRFEKIVASLAPTQIAAVRPWHAQMLASSSTLIFRG